MVAPRDSATVARGEYIFKYTWQCWSCHAANAVDANSPPSGGSAFDLRSVGPGFGIYYSRNITPDSSTGIGSWSDGEIVQAIREGIRKDRHVLFPLMPVHWLKGMSDEDVLALVAYIRSIPPVRARVPDPAPSFMAKALIAFNVIKPLPELTRPIVAPPSGVSPEYGRYFALNVAGCADCHTPRNLGNGEFYLDSLCAGSTIAYGEPEHDPIASYARNIRPDDVDGIGRWTEEQFLTAVTSGMTPGGVVLDPHMPYNHYKFLRSDDVRAVYIFLKSLEPIKRFTPDIRISPEFRAARGAARGELLFKARCQSCHGKEGNGALPTNVRLADVASSLEEKDLHDFIAGGQMNLKMPSFGATLNNGELDDLVSYIRSWKGQ